MTPIVELRHVTKQYPAVSGFHLRTPMLTAVQDVSLSIESGESFGIVGESGCGKSTMARIIMCLDPVSSGEVYFEGNRVDTLRESKRRPIRAQFQMVFQDPGSSLNPRKNIESILREPMLHHHIGTREEIDHRIDELLELVGLPSGVRNRFPHEFSGGQRQRICIARALSLNPRLLILDEPVSSLDVSVQAQILNLLRDLQKNLGITFLFIGHGLSAVHYVSTRIAVMYMGRIVEIGDSESLFEHPAHPYTVALLDAASDATIKSRDRSRLQLTGEITAGPVHGCPLIPRCPLANEHCRENTGELLPVAPQHVSACMRGMGGLS